MNRKTQLILLALEELKNASYSVERREECEELIREIEMDKRIYDLEVKCEDGTWMVWETAEGLEEANNMLFAEREEMRLGEIPRREVRKVRRKD